MSMTLSSLDALMQKEAHEKKIPLAGDFEITARCNLDCVMCYVRKSPENLNAIKQELSAEEIIEIAKQARDAGMIYILLTGGEIFLRKDFKYIYEEISNLGLLITLYTNGTMITPEIADWLVLRPPRKISISIYGASPGTYEKVTGSKNAYHKVVNAINLLVDRGLRVELKTTWVQGNVDDFYELRKLAAGWNLKLYVVNYIFPNREAENSDPVGNRLDPDRLAKMEADLEAIEVAEIEKDNNPIEAISIIEPDESKVKGFNSNDNVFTCDAAITSFWLTWDGYLTPCGIMSTPKVAIKKLRFTDSLDELRELVKEIPTCSACNICEYKASCMTCPARLYAESNNYNQPAEYLCSHAKKRAQINSEMSE